MDCDVAASPGCPLAKGRGDRAVLGAPGPWYLLALSGTHIPHCVQLHLHSHLRGRDDTKGSSCLHLGPLPPPVVGSGVGPGPALSWFVTHLLVSNIPLRPQKPIPAWYPHWATGTQGVGLATSLLSRRSQRVRKANAGKHLQCNGGTCWRRGAQGKDSIRFPERVPLN